jgi:hypothetical protein
MAEPQRVAFGEVMAALQPRVGHHGLCVGADAQFHYVCRDLGVRIEGHPPVDPKLRAWLQCDVLHPEKPYLARDWDIVRVAEVLVATPRERPWKGGTWRTVGFANQVERRTILIRPDGMVLDSAHPIVAGPFWVDPALPQAEYRAAVRAKADLDPRLFSDAFLDQQRERSAELLKRYRAGDVRLQGGSVAQP